MIEVFIPIKKDNLSHYFGAGIIKPKAYFEQDTITDIQDNFPNHIFALTDKNYMPQNSDCLISVNMKEEEKIESACGVFFSFPIPLSRVRCIYVKNIDEIDNIINNITMETNKFGGTAYIDKQIFQELSNIENIKIEISKPIDETIDLTDRLDKFDRMLGAMAFLRYTDFGTYKKGFFDELAALNSAIYNEFKSVTNFNPNISNPKIKYKHLDIYRTKDYKTQVAHYHSVSISGLGGYMDDNGKFQISENLPFRISNYIDAFKYLYNIQTLADHIYTEWEKMNDDLLFLYGYNMGYTCLRSKYENKKVKFNLHTYIDMITLEIIYQYAILNNENTDITFLSYLQTEKKESKALSKYYLFDAKEPIEINDFVEDLAFYHNEPKIIQIILDEHNLFKRSNRLVQILEKDGIHFRQTQEYCKKNIDVIKNEIPNLAEQLESTNRQMNILADAINIINKQAEYLNNVHNKIRNSQVNFYKFIMSIPNLEQKNIDENSLASNLLTRNDKVTNTTQEKDRQQIRCEERKIILEVISKLAEKSPRQSAKKFAENVKKELEIKLDL